MAVSRHTRAARWGGALLLALAPLPWLGIGSAQATDGATYATVTGHAPSSPASNQPGYWGDDCRKIFYAGGIDSYVLTRDYALVVVKAAADDVGANANTLFADASAGETVWADTNGNGVFDVGGPNGDKGISHIIACVPGQTASPSPSESQSTGSASPSESQSTGSASPSESQSSGSASPSESQSTGSASPSESQSSGSASPSESQSSGSASPSESQSSGSASPSKSHSQGGGPTEIESSGAAALPQTGSGTPIVAAVGLSLLLIGIGMLLLLGPGRLVPATAHRRRH